MINIKNLFINAFIHTLVPLVYFIIIVTFESLFTTVSFITFLIISTIVSTISYAYLNNKGVWNYLLSFPIYILVLIIVTLITLALEKPVIQSENQAHGLLLIFLLGYSFITLGIGNLLGILFRKYLFSRNSFPM